MGVPHGRSDAAIGDDAGDLEHLDPRLAQNPFEPRHVECGIGDLLNREIGGRQFFDQRMAPMGRAGNRPWRGMAAAPSGAARS
jgi:hypothetical protein